MIVTTIISSISVNPRSRFGISLPLNQLSIDGVVVFAHGAPINHQSSCNDVPASVIPFTLSGDLTPRVRTRHRGIKKGPGHNAPGPWIVLVADLLTD